jgi:multicomponent Na+:H+ antiporter subunit G
MMILELIGCCFLVAGSIFSVIGGIGIVRLPEFFSRIHGGGITDTMGAGLVIIGLMFLAGPSLITFKLAVILFFLTVTSPSSCHALAKSALTHGLKPQLDVPANSNLTDGPQLIDELVDQNGDTQA